MRDSRRYRMNAAGCLLAAKTCQPPFRGLILAVATSWQTLACQDEAVEELLGLWGCPDFAPALSAARNGKPKEIS
jgi:hypothetical protein